MRQAIDDAGLSPDEVSDNDTGIMTANGGSLWMSNANLTLMDRRGVMKTPPMAIINGIPGSLYINLVPAFRIKGASLGFSSACSSSAHALGMATDLVRTGRQKRVFVVGAEDCNRYNILPFAGVRALSLQTDPEKSPCAFDRKRDGFVGTGGAAVLVVEELDAARERGAANIYAEVLGWGQASDGYNVLASAPDGDGLARTMQLALKDAGVTTDDIEHINAHATSTPFGDVSGDQRHQADVPGGTAAAGQLDQEPDGPWAVAGRGDGSGILLSVVAAWVRAGLGAYHRAGPDVRRGAGDHAAGRVGSDHRDE